MKKLLPKDTLWLTWTEVGDLAGRRAHRSKIERFLCRQFHEMLRERGVPMVQPITSGEYNKLGVVNHFVVGRYRGLTEKTFDVINNVMARMRVLADDSWKDLSDCGYSPYSRLYRLKDEVESYAEIEVGFYMQKKRKRVRESYICLGIDCRDMRLFAWDGWVLGKDHPNRDADTGGKYLKQWTRSESEKLFKKPLQEAQRLIQSDLQNCLKRFKNSHYYKM